MRYSHPTLQRTVRFALVAALIAWPACATTTTQTPISIDTAPPPGFYKIMGVTLADGMAISFVEPAAIERDSSGTAVVRGKRETTYQGSPARVGITIPVSDIETFWVIAETTSVEDSTGEVAGAVAGVTLICLLLGSCD